MYLACLKVAAVVTGIAWCLLAIPLYLFGEPPVIWGAVWGFLLSAFCFTAGFYAICRALHASLNQLMIAVFGGMLARMLLIGTIFLLVVSYTSLHAVSFLSLMLGFYMLYIVIELYFVKNRLAEGG